MIKNFLVRVCRGLLNLTRSIASGIERGVMPSPMSPTAVQENITWGQRWIAGALASALAGETVHVTRVDLVMLALFIASIVIARHGLSRPVIVYQATQAR